MELRSRKQKYDKGKTAGYSKSGEEAGISTGASLPFKILHEYLGPLFFCLVCPWTTQFIWLVISFITEISQIILDLQSMLYLTTFHRPNLLI